MKVFPYSAITECNHYVDAGNYQENPVRQEVIQATLENDVLFQHVRTQEFPDIWLKEIHSERLLTFLNSITCNEKIHPDVFPGKTEGTPRTISPRHAGCICFDSYSPVYRAAVIAAREAVNTALTGAEYIVKNKTELFYALTRPPGHHAESDRIGGFCYLNNTAVAANYFSKHGKTAVLDLDFHHGNGTQEIFYDRKDVLTVSIHGHPEEHYPYFSGYADERGTGPGEGYNINYPLKTGISPNNYFETVDRALEAINRFEPDYIALALGLDTAKGDSAGNFRLEESHFKSIGTMISKLRCPALTVQEGGYNIKSLDKNLSAFLYGLSGSGKG